MGELNADSRVLTLHEGDQGLEALHLGIVPDAKVMLVDQADLLDSRRLDQDQPKTTQRVAAELHVVKTAAGAARRGAVVYYRRHHQPVLQGQAADLVRLEQHGSCSVNAVGDRGWHGISY